MRVKQVVTKQVEDGGRSQRLCLVGIVFVAGTAVFMLVSLKNILFSLSSKNKINSL